MVRDTHSTAAVGVFATPIVGLFIVVLGCAVDLLWRRAVRRSHVLRSIASALVHAAERANAPGAVGVHNLPPALAALGKTGQYGSCVHRYNRRAFGPRGRPQFVGSFRSSRSSRR
jgi:hypothetical protein